MKKSIYLVPLMITVILFSCQNKDSTYQHFVGEDIGYFLKNNPDYIDLRIESGKPGFARSLLILFKDSISIELVPTDFKHMKAFDIKGEWDMDSLKKEQIKEIYVFKNDSLIEAIPEGTYNRCIRY